MNIIRYTILKCFVTRVRLWRYIVGVQVYRGDATFYQLTGLQPNTDYCVRVCAVRECQDDSGEQLTGNFSPSKAFMTHKETGEVAEEVASTPSSKMNGAPRSAVPRDHEPKPAAVVSHESLWKTVRSATLGTLQKLRSQYSDQQRAFLLLFVFSVIAFCIAFLAKSIITDPNAASSATQSVRTATADDNHVHAQMDNISK